MTFSSSERDMRLSARRPSTARSISDLPILCEATILMVLFPSNSSTALSFLMNQSILPSVLEVMMTASHSESSGSLALLGTDTLDRLGP